MENTVSLKEIHWCDQPWTDHVLGFLNRYCWALFIIQFLVIVVLVCLTSGVTTAYADTVRLPGEDISSQMEGAGTLLRFVDTAIFSWVARLLCGLCVGGAAWSLKEARFGGAVIAIVSAILFGTAPTWVKNIFSITGANSVFSQVDTKEHAYTIVLSEGPKAPAQDGSSHA